MATSRSRSYGDCGCPGWWARRQGRGSDDGFTLIELVIVLVIIPIIIGGITVAMITSLKAVDTRSPNDPTCKVDPTCAQSTAERLAESHDSQITSTLFVRDVESATAIDTTNTALCGTGAQVLGLQWSSGTNTVSVSYVTKLVGISNLLARQICSTGSPQSNTTAAHNLSSAAAPLVILACSSLDNSPPMQCAKDAGSSSAPISTLDVASVTITITEASGFKFSLSASPRLLLSPTSDVVASTPPLLLGSAGAQCDQGLIVNGVVAVNSRARGSIDVGREELSASQVYSQNTHTGSRGPVSGTYDPPAAYDQGPALFDPLSILPAPSPSGANTFVYKNAPLTTGNDPSDPTGTKLLSGIYILDHGISGSFTSDQGGVFLYVADGSVTLGGRSSLDLSAMTSGTYAGVLLYQVPSDTKTLSLQDVPSLHSLNGAIDASTATAQFGGRGVTIAAQGLIASGLDCNDITGVFGPISTSTSLVCSTGCPAVTGEAATYTATVSVTPSGLGTPTGNIEFFDGGTPIAVCGGASGNALTGPDATCVVTYDAVGSHTITAMYLGDGNFPASPTSSPVTENVTRAGTSTSIVCTSGCPSVSGQPVTYTATVTPTAPGSGTPTGKVEFFDGGTPISVCGGASGNALSGSNATCSVTYSVGGNHMTTAMYLGDPNYAASSVSSSINSAVAGLIWQKVMVDGNSTTPVCSGVIGTTYACTVNGGNSARLVVQVGFADTSGAPTTFSNQDQTINITTTGQNGGNSTLTIPGNSTTSSGTAGARKRGPRSAQITATYGSWTATITVN